MKLLKTGALLALLTACYLSAPAQGLALPANEPDRNKPKIFADLPERLNLNLADLEALLNLPVGSPVHAVVAPGFTLRGTVISKSNPADASVKSVVVSSLARGNATLTFTRTTAKDGTVKYLGRMLSKSASDALEIVKEGADYVIRKKGYYDLINE